MAFGEEFLTFAVEETLKKLGSIVIDEATRIWGLKKDLKKLKKTIESLQDILHKAEDSQETTDTNDWLAELQDLVYHADDVMDEFSYEILRRKIEIGEKLRHKVSSFVCCYYNPLLFRAKMAYKVKKINDTLVDLKEQAMTKFSHRAAAGVGPRGAPSDQAPHQISTDSFIDESKPLVGRTEELNGIITFLRTNSSCRLNIVSIVGFGGLGKTTLAKLVHEQVKRENLFDETVWVDVSKTSTPTDILGEMLQKVEGRQLTNTDAIRGCLRAKLEKKRFLLVLDNAWSKLKTDWQWLKGCLLQISESLGNSIIITTRNSDLASVMENSSLFLVNLPQLKDEECWSIIKRICEGEGSYLPEDLKSIGFDMARKCKGVPLVAEVLGRTLCSKKDGKEWASIRDSNVWESVGTDNILPVLRLSFDRLRSPLKQCFSYCSLYPKNYVFEKEKLIQLWMAEGFLHPTWENVTASKISMEDMGDEFFNELRGNSFFQDDRVDKWGNIISCKMHDLLHDLAISVSNRTMLNQDDGSSSYTFKTHDCRRVSFLVHGEQHPILEDFVKDFSKRIRSLNTNKVVIQTWTNFRSLRSLNLYGANCNELPVTIAVLKHLRYLDISMNGQLKVLPDSITKLYNLQTLRVVDCSRLTKLPNNIGILVSLRHIHFNYHYLVPYKVGSLTNLRTLPLFFVRQEVGYEIQELKQLNELRGKLNIFDLQHVRNGNEALTANLKGKKLTKLRLEWDDDTKREDEWDAEDVWEASPHCNHKEVLEGLVPPESITSLRIEGYMGKLFPDWMSRNGGSESTLNQLAKLKLLGCKKIEIMPTLGNLPRLKILEIEGMDNVKRIGSEFFGESKGNVKLFPKLETLQLCKMWCLEEWEAPDDINHGISFLQKLVICDNRLLKRISLSHLFSLKSMKIQWCRELISLPQGLKSLKHLSIDRPGKLSVDAFLGLSSLETLHIERFWSVKLLPSVEDLISLKTLTIISCDLTSLPVGLLLLKYLERLEIYGCDKLTALSPEIKSCTSLKDLSVTYCRGLISIETDIINSLTQLKALALGHFSDELVEFPGFDKIRAVNNQSLEELRLNGWGVIKLLPYLGHLEALKVLCIFEFGISELPSWLSKLSKLTYLIIDGCHLLVEKFQEDPDTLWPNISHIAYISMNSKVIQDLRSTTNP